MALPAARAAPTPARNRTRDSILFLTYGAVAAREITSRAESENLWLAATLLGAVLLLLATDPALFRRFGWYRYLYFALQTILIQALGFLPPYTSMWGLLYTFLAVQAWDYLPRKYLVAWGGAAAVLLTVTLMATLPPIRAPGLALTYVGAAVLFVSWNVYSTQAEAARRESEDLLDELRRAHRQLQVYASEAEAQAASRERDSIAQQLHDSVGQTIFGIALGAEATRLLLAKDAARVPAELEWLQALTTGALAQMRSLIAQWRPR